MGNIVPRAGRKPTSLAIQVSVQLLHQVGFLTSLLYPRAPVYVALCLRGQCDYYTRPPGIVSLLMLTITIHRIGLTTIQYILCRGSWSWQSVS